MLIATNAIVLKRIPYGDTSVICRVFTEGMGKVSILAKGAWRPKNAAGPLLEPINHIHIQFYNKNTREIQILKDAGFVQQFPVLRNSLGRIILAFAIVEIIDKSTLESNPSPILYRLGWRVLDKLNDKNQNFWFVFAFFLYQFSIRLGFMPNLKNCSKCNKDIIQGSIDDYSGELVCSDCIVQSKIKISENSCFFLKQLSDLHLDDLNTLSLSNSDIIESVRFLESFLLFHVEGFKKVQTMDMVKNLLSKSINL